MAEERYTGTKPFELKELSILSNKQKAFDIKEQLVELTIYEDMFATSLSAVLIIADAKNMVSNLPIVGGEKIRVRFRTEGYEDYVTLVFVVYKIAERANTDLRTQMYSLMLTTEDMMTSNGMFISKAYNGDRGEIIQAVLNDMSSERELLRNDIIASTNYISPRWTPFDVIKYLTSESYNAKGSPCLFYETIDGYVFTSIASIIDPNIEAIKNLTYTTIQANNEKPKDSDVSFDNVMEYSFSDSVDKMHLLSNGSFKNRLVSVDLDQKTHVNNDFSYVDQFDEIPTIDRFPVYDADDTGEKQFFTTGVSVDSATMQKRKAALDFLTNNGLTAMIPGDSHLRVGKPINFKIPSAEPHQDRFLSEKLTSGRFLLTACKHIIKKSSYVNGIELFKDSYGIDFNSINGEIV
ncbi:MAG: hypothetical protein KAS32_24205 [Candidatus Peribacteraceae bacterium]|nr:hypothetical protein [Candidatus Peribacteraceae bacterium]